MRRLYLACAFVIAVTPVAMLAQPVPAAAEAALLAAEDTRFHAELTHDATTLDRMTAADVVYSHVNGAREDKAALMQTFTHLPFSSITPFGRHARVIGDIGVVRGDIVRQLPDRTLSDSYLAIYLKAAGEWQLLEWMSGAPSSAAMQMKRAPVSH